MWGVAGFEHDRRCSLKGGRDCEKWDMIRHITIATRANRRRYRQMFDHIGLPKTHISSTSALDDFYRLNGLSAITRLARSRRPATAYLVETGQAGSVSVVSRR